LRTYPGELIPIVIFINLNTNFSLKMPSNKSIELIISPKILWKEMTALYFRFNSRVMRMLGC